MKQAPLGLELPRRVLAKAAVTHMTDEALIEKHLKPMLNATKTIFVKHQGKVTDEREAIARGPRIASLDLVSKAGGCTRAGREL